MEKIPKIFLTHASDILGDTEKGLSGNEIVKAFNAFASDYRIEEIPYSSYPFDAPNKRTALLENLSIFSPEQQYEIIKQLCNHPKLPQPISKEINNLKIQLIARYSYLSGKSNFPTLDQSLIEEIKSFLSNYPKSEKLYLDALKKLNNNIFERNLVDDLRLSLELLLKDIFNNQKSLENQIANIGRFIGKHGGSKEFTNMFKTLIDYYTKYQNNFVKHNDAMIEDEVEFIFEITSSFMKHLIKMKNI